MLYTIRSLYCHRISSGEFLGLGLSTLVHQGHYLLDTSADLQVTKPQPSHLNHLFSGFSLFNNMLIKSQLNIPKMAILKFLQKKLVKEIINLILFNVGISCMWLIS